MKIEKTLVYKYDEFIIHSLVGPASYLVQLAQVVY
jgi:hypothetical protein